MCEKHSGDGLSRIGCLAFPVPYSGGKSFGRSLSRVPFFLVRRKSGEEMLYIKSLSCEKNIFFRLVKNLPQEI